MNRYFALVALLVASVAAEAPYPASGWRPEGAQFRLPTEYAAPLLVFQPQPQRVQVQISREDVRFAGQQIALEPQTTTVEPAVRSSTPVSSTTNQPEPEGSELKVQGLPSEQTTDFQQRSNLRQQPASVNRPLPANFAQRQFFPISGQLRALPPVGTNVFQRQAVQPEAEQQQPLLPQAVPADTYGPPQEQPEEVPVTTEQTDVQPEDGEEDYDDDNGRAVVAVSNSFSGQYYVLAPDNTLQRVIYSTMQTDEDRLVNGFSAQLKYSPVDPIRDPVYTYNEEGQLVRIYKK